MAEKNTQNHIVFEEYKQRFSNLDTSNSDSQETPLLEIFNKFSPQLLLISMMWNAAYFLCQIILFSMESERSPAFYLTVGLFCTCVGLFVIRFKSETGRSLQIKNKSISSFSYSIVYIHVVLITFLSLFMEDRINGNHVSILERFPYDLYLVLSGCLIPFQFELKTLLRHRQLTIIYFIFTLGEIILTGIITGNIIHMFITSTIFTFVFSILFYVKKGEIFMDSKLKETNRITEKTFGHLESVIKVLNAGTLLFKNENLFYANEIGRSVLDKVASSLFNNITEDLNDTKKVIENIGLKYSTEDSIWKPSNLDQNTIRSIFSNILLHEDTSNIHELVNECSHTNEFSFNEISSKNLLIVEEKEEELINLFSILQFLTNSCSSSKTEHKCTCSRFKENNQYINLGVFKIGATAHKNFYFEIFTKVENSSTGEKMIEFIFKEVTFHYDLINKMDEKDLCFKKNAHEFKTPILSLLGCAEELKSHMNIIDYLLPEKEKNIFNNCLDHVTNLSSYIGYLIRGVTKSKKETSDKSNLITDYKEIKLNSLLNFCLKILQTLVSCDSQKQKYIKTELKNDMVDCDVSFISNEIQVKQILLNFISNSVKFTNHGSIKMKAQTKKKNQNDVLKIIIKDTGCGIKKEDKLKLFQEYSKFNNSENNAFGTGLGLNICKSIADNLNMKIKFKSEVNKGTKVVLYIFNSVIKDKEKFLESRKIWKMSEGNSNSGMVNLKSTCDNDLVNTRQTLIIEENEINLEDNSVRKVLIKQTTLISSSGSGSSVLEINQERQSSNNLNRERERNKLDNSTTPVRSEISYSLISCKISELSDTFDIDANNQKSTVRLGRDHDYGFIPVERNMLTQYIPEYNIKKHATIASKSIKNPFVSFNYFRNSEKLPKLSNEVSPRKKISSLNINEIKPRLSQCSLRTISSLNLKSKKSLFSTEKILVIDDQLHPRQALVNLITRHIKEKDLKYDIIQGCDGIDCLRAITKFPFNVAHIFMDENMCYMNGTETAAIIRRLYNSGKITKINMVMTSADDGVNDKQKLFDFYLTKPLVRENIKTVMEFMK